MDQGQTLLQLQDADIEIRRAEKQLDELPVKRKILETRRKAKEVGELKAKAELLVSKLERQMAANEDETSQVSDKIDAEQDKVMSGDITNPKEVQAITREMDALRRRKEKLEMENLALMERVEKARLQIGKIEVALQQLATQEAKQTEEFRAAGGELQTNLDSARARRDELATALEAGLLERYESIATAKGGLGAASLNATVCTACRMELPAQQLEALRTGPQIGVCPACHRLLVIMPAEESE